MRIYLHFCFPYDSWVSLWSLWVGGRLESRRRSLAVTKLITVAREPCPKLARVAICKCKLAATLLENVASFFLLAAFAEVKFLTAYILS